MPCNIGYRETFKATVAVPKPQAFRARGKAPRVDRELLKRIGVEDSEFAAWFRELDVIPLLKVALDRTRQQVDTQGMQLSITPKGLMAIDAPYRRESQRARLAARTDRVLERWSFEVLAIVAQVLGYETRLTQSPALTLQAEKQTDERVRESFSVTQSSGTVSRLRFEHFKTRKALKQEISKAMALARKCGLSIRLEEGEEGGQAVAEGQVGGDFQAGSQ